MKAGKFNVLLDAFWGSSGKGKVANFLARRFNVTAASSCNMPNAGHTVERLGMRVVNKVLPSAAIFNPLVHTCFLGPGSIFKAEQYGKEVEDRNYFSQTLVHERACFLEEKHGEQERARLSTISSTMQGSGAALCEKVMRESKLLNGAMFPQYSPGAFRTLMHDEVNRGVFLHEVSQGWALSLDHGTHYPHCTSRNCTVQAAMDQMCITPNMVGDVYLNLRTYPIRVGNTADGYSGDFAPWCEETTWDAVAAAAGLDAEELKKREFTTVTKRLRRVGTFPLELAREAARYSGATKLVITFAEYIDARAAGVRVWEELPEKVKDFCAQVEKFVGVPVAFVSTGADSDDMVEVCA